MKKTLTTVLLLCILTCASAQDGKTKDVNRFSPKAGSLSLGLSIDPLAATAFNFQPGNGDFLGEYISAIAANPQQMFLISPNSAVAIRMKYYTGEKFALKFSLGFTGSCSSYKEYVSDDYATKVVDPASQDVVTDVLKSNLGGASLTVGFESIFGSRSVRFTIGASVGYALGGGRLTMNYGNPIALYNGYNPTVMPNCSRVADGSAQGPLNNISKAEVERMGYVNARPISRYNMGICQSLGLFADMGIEWFCVDRMSIGAQLSILPLCVYFQPQTHSEYEGFSNRTGNVEKYTKMVSPGSTSFSYGLGLNNLGLKLSVNYYLF